MEKVIDSRHKTVNFITRSKANTYIIPHDITWRNKSSNILWSYISKTFKQKYMERSNTTQRPIYSNAEVSMDDVNYMEEAGGDTLRRRQSHGERPPNRKKSSTWYQSYFGRRSLLKANSVITIAQWEKNKLGRGFIRLKMFLTFWWVMTILFIV